jgi:hypothetical protein
MLGSCLGDGTNSDFSKTRMEPTLCFATKAARAAVATPPELAPDPVADQPLVLGDPASDVPSHLAVADDRADDVRGLVAELGPMCHEGVMIPRGKRRHPHGFRVALMLEEDRKVGVDDVAQNHLHTSNENYTKDFRLTRPGEGKWMELRSVLAFDTVRRSK